MSVLTQINRECQDPPVADRGVRLLALVRDTAAELQHRPREAVHATLDSALDRDLGLDSLARVELIARIERAFGVNLAENTLERAATPRELLAALENAAPAAPHQARELARAEAQLAVETGQPAAATTLLEALDWHVERHGDRTHVRVLTDEREEIISYRELRSRAARVAAALRARGLEPRQTVAIMLPTSPDYFEAFIGILMAGGVPVPIYPPARVSQIGEHVQRHAAILENAGIAMLLTAAEVLPVARLIEAHLPAHARVLTVRELAAGREELVAMPPRAGDLAFIQYTSGSTGNPKGVALTHANLLANIRAMGEAVRASAGDVFVSWLPLYHDMGLIGAWLGSLYVGFTLVVMSPLAFLTRPERWLWAIHRYRGTLSAAPNFAYELAVKRVSEADVEGLDLSSWRMAFNGAEAVSPDTIERFCARYARHGFRRESMTPVYGLAEASVGLLFPPPDRGPLVDRVERDALAREGVARPSAAHDALRFVSCGSPMRGHEVRIVDDAGLEVGERVEGRLQFRGPSATHGYYRNEAQTRRLFDGGWLETGDRAYGAAGEIYVTGRIKDIVIRAGRHIYPDEVEAAVGAIAGVRKGCVAVFGSHDARSGTERVIVLAETRERDAQARDALRASIAAAVAALVGEPADEIVLAPPHTVLKTSSGKVRRSASRALYESGAIRARPRSAARQIVSLAAYALLPQVRRAFALARSVAYGLYAGALLLAIGAAAWVATAFTRDPARAWALGGAAARLYFRLAGMRLTVLGAERVPQAPGVLVANHASYFDGVVIAAAIARPYRFVAKRELESRCVAGLYLRKLGAVFVERFDARQSVEDAARLARCAAGGESLAFFPEGTFVRGAGLMPFHLGAFHAAAHARVPVVPVAIRGTRSILRGEQRLPRRGGITVTVGQPIPPPVAAGDEFAAAIELRDAARAAILDACGEPDLAPAL